MNSAPLDPAQAKLLAGELGERPREVFRHLVDAYLTSGEPVGSRTLSQRLPLSLSPASIRNVMADLEAMGLLYAPHTSAGRVPTEQGLAAVRRRPAGNRRTGARRTRLHRSAHHRHRAAHRGCADAGDIDALGPVALRGLLVSAKQDAPLKHVEFVAVAPGKALVVIVGEDGQVENRLIDTPLGLPTSALSEAANYINARLRGRTLDAARVEITKELEGERARTGRADRQDRGRGPGDAGRALRVRHPAKRKC